MNVGDGGVTVGSGDCGQRCSRRAATVHEVAVVRVRDRMDRVDVGDEPARRLRLTDAEHPLRVQAAEDLLGVGADRPGGLGEDVVRVAVAGMRQRSVARLVAARRRRRSRRTVRQFQCVETGCLRGDADPRVPLADQLVVHVHPVGARVDTTRHVEPLDDDRAVELPLVDRPIDDDARLVRGRRRRRDRPLPVARERGGRRVRVRGALEEELGLGVADRAEVERGVREHERDTVAARDRTGDRRPTARGLGAAAPVASVTVSMSAQTALVTADVEPRLPPEARRTPHLTAGERTDVTVRRQPVPQSFANRRRTKRVVSTLEWPRRTRSPMLEAALGP